MKKMVLAMVLECMMLLCLKTPVTRGLCMVKGNCEAKKTRKLDIPAFYSSRTPTYEQCCALCASVGRCVSVNYDNDTYTCQLLADIGVHTAPTAFRSYTHGTFLKSTTKEPSNQCRSRPCKQHEICVTTRSGGGYICLLGGPCSHAPAVQNTSSHLDFVTLSTGQATYTCDTGYIQLQGSGVSTCSITGGWTLSTLVCDRIDCGSPHALLNLQTGVTTSTRYLDQVNYTCQVGYTYTEGEGISVCQPTGQWSSPTIQCQAKAVCVRMYLAPCQKYPYLWVVDCGYPSPVTNMDLGTVIATEYSSQVTLTCSSGFESKEPGGITIECQEDASWSTPLMTCQRLDCDLPPPIVNMTFNVTSTLYESEAEYVCDVGFNVRSGSGFSRCDVNGLWETPTLLCEVVDCGVPPTMTNMTATSVPSTLYSSVVDYSCNVGYQQNGGSGNSVCQSDGTWSTPTLDCPIVDCGAARVYAHHELVDVEATVYNSTATYRCPLGQFSTASGVTVCLNTGQWSPLDMDCIAVPGILYTLESTSASAQLQCITRVSGQGTAPSVWCQNGEVLTGCSAITVAEGTKSRGALLSLSAAKCVASADAAIIAVARCCAREDLQCEYIKLTDQTSACVKGFQLTDCSCGAKQYNHRHCRLNHTSHSCVPQPVAVPHVSFYYALCCTSPGLSCYQKSADFLTSGGSTADLSVQCEVGEVMTGCSGYNFDTNIQGAEILTDTSGRDTCVVKPGVSNATTLTGYANCCVVL